MICSCSVTVRGVGVIAYFTLRPPGGIAGAASRITGAMAKGVAAITMDEEYQQKRREAMNKQPSSLKEGLTRGGKGLVSVRSRTAPLVLLEGCWRAGGGGVQCSSQISQ